MNSEAQRARNKRKRDKLREKHRQNRASSILRFRLDGFAEKWDHLCGLAPRMGEEDQYTLCSQVPRDDMLDSHEIEWSTEWVYMATHDLSSSAADAIQCFCNTASIERTLGAFDFKIVLLLQLNGVSRRYVWRGHTVGAKFVGKVVCSFVKQQSKEE